MHLQKDRPEHLVVGTPFYFASFFPLFLFLLFPWGGSSTCSSLEVTQVFVFGIVPYVYMCGRVHLQFHPMLRVPRCCLFDNLLRVRQHSQQILLLRYVTRLLMVVHEL